MVPKPQKSAGFPGNSRPADPGAVRPARAFPCYSVVSGELVSLEAVLGLTGSGQFWLYGPEYAIVVCGVLLVWFALFLQRLDRRSCSTIR